MLRNSFLFLDGIGPRTEFRLWQEGMTSWSEFVDRERVPRISAEKKAVYNHQLATAEQRLSILDAGYFASKVPSREQWRCLQDFNRNLVYLDIETTGISPRSPITVVGIFDGTRMYSLVRGLNLDIQGLSAILSRASMLVTFNGSSFDLPMIASQFPGALPNVPHADMKHALRRVGLSGGLKAVERELGIERDRRVEYMTGEDAVYLWKLWEKRGNRNALNLLLEYNAEDTRNLKRLSRYAYTNLRRMTFDKAVAAAKD